ncbi:MAG: lactate utilization protein [Halanaerobiaceae bacterium]|nr:lactate utilization protein [Halanaerobiaceae bacterium]
MEAVKKYYQIKAERLIRNFERRGIEAYYCPDAGKAVEKVLDLIPGNASVSWGGSMTLKQIGLLDKLREKDLKLLDRDTAKTDDEKRKIQHEAFNCDYYLMSSNAITEDGKLVNIDGNGNRIAALIYGPANVIVIAGMNKVTADEDSAIKRIRTYAAPMNAIRLNKNTPCTRTGSCQDCLSDDCICSQILVTRKSNYKKRIKVILVGEELGF